jgi:4-aminobutyrate aminotransferase
MNASLRPQIITAPPGPRAQAIIDVDARYSSPSYIKEYPLVVERGEGPFLMDVDGNTYLDMMAGIAVTSTGHSHPHVVEAIQQAAAKFLHICGTDFYYDTFSKLCERLALLVPDMGPNKVFLTNSGTEAVEGAIKLARYHTRRPWIVAFKGGFHGRTTGAIALNASKVTQRAHFGPLMPSVLHIPYPHPRRCPYQRPAEACCTDCRCGTALETDWFPSYVAPSEIAAIIVEPILGEGGYVVPPRKFLQDLRALCDRHGILLIFDEVQSGIGRTGDMFAAETMGVSPDILLSAKGIASGMPIGAIIARESVMTWPRGSHGSTYGGNPVCCAAALATLDVIEPLLPQIRRVGAYLQQKLRALAARHPVLWDIRGEGLMIGAEFVDPKTGEPAADLVGQLEQAAFRRGLLLLSCGKSTIRFAPPLIVEEAHIDMAIEILDACLTDLTAD